MTSEKHGKMQKKESIRREMDSTGFEPVAFIFSDRGESPLDPIVPSGHV